MGQSIGEDLRAQVGRSPGADARAKKRARRGGAAGHGLPNHRSAAQIAPPRAQRETDGPAYRLVPVGSSMQRAVFIGLQALLLVTLLYISTQVLTLFLSQFISDEMLRVVLVVYCVSAVVWQTAYVYRILQMQRAVPCDASVPSGMRLAMATTIVPSREIDLLEGKLEGMVRVNRFGNDLDCWVLDEEDDPRVRALVEKFDRRHGGDGLRVLHFSRKGMPGLNEGAEGRRYKRFQRRQKGGNINAWVHSISLDDYDSITILDLDHVPLAHFYEKVLPYLQDPDVAYVQGPDSFHNRDYNFISRAASYERDTFFGLVHRSYFGLGMAIIVGSHTTFRPSALRALGGYYPVHLTEDYLMMLELRAKGQKGIFIDDVIAVGELPTTWDAYVAQQRRWSAGGIDLLLRDFPRLFREYSWKERLFGFSLLNYYAWGTFYVVFKAFVYLMVLAGLSLYLGSALYAAIIVFSVVSAVANFLWERQFFIERDRKIFFIQNCIASNFLGSHYFVSLLKAIGMPNAPFAVTAKSDVARAGAHRVSAALLVSIGFVAVEVAALAATSISQSAHGLFEGNALVLPLAISAAGNLYVMLLWRRLEGEASTETAEHYDSVALPIPDVAVQK